jgi:predicted metal-binding protein
MSLETTSPTHVLHVCTSCRVRGTPRVPASQRPGVQLFKRLQAAVANSPLSAAVRVQPAECLSICPRPCGIALSSPGRWTYLFGDQHPDRSVDAILSCVAVYLASKNGFMARGDRPATLRASILGRIPCSAEAAPCT